MKTFANRYEIGEACLAHMTARLAETESQLAPYPHFWTDRILPDDVYDRMLRELPASSVYHHGGAESKHYGNRASLHLTSNWIEQAPEASKELWFGIRLALASTDLKRAIFENLSAGFAHRLKIAPSTAADVPAFPRPMLYQEVGGYSIAPHPDTRRKLATVQFALTDDESQLGLGTSIYKMSANPKHLMREPRGFVEVKRYPFARNSMFAFAVVNTVSMRSWHGREALPPNCGKRNTLLQIYYGEAVDANPEMLPEAMRLAQVA